MSLPLLTRCQCFHCDLSLIRCESTREMCPSESRHRHRSEERRQRVEAVRDDNGAYTTNRVCERCNRKIIDNDTMLRFASQTLISAVAPIRITQHTTSCKTQTPLQSYYHQRRVTRRCRSEEHWRMSHMHTRYSGRRVAAAFLHAASAPISRAYSTDSINARTRHCCRCCFTPIG